jgi:alpha-mannosidase
MFHALCHSIDEAYSAMKFTELTVLLPCHSLEDFPVYHEAAPADELLAAWCALWHPALVASAGAVPTWQRIDVPSEVLAGRLIAVPPFCLDRLPAGFVARAKNEGAWVVHESSRDAAVAAALGGLDGGDAGVDSQLAADFLALGFCRLQIELLTRQMRYSMNIDETHFQNELVVAAQAAVAHDAEAARAHLQLCFDTLYEARKHFYPVDVYLLDVTLVAAATLGQPLRTVLSNGTPTNLLAPMALLRQIRADAVTWPLLLSAIDAGTLTVLGGEREERELPLLSLETALAELSAGVSEYEDLLGRRPQVYGRRRAGLGPGLPQLLTKLAYQGALHFTLDDGRFPLGPQSKTRWEGLDSSVIDVLARVPSDAAKSETFLSLSRKLADSMDSDHVATLALAHWPGATSPWYDDLRRIARLSGVLGKFILLDDFFSHTDMPGRLSKFEPDEYRTPYLKQAIIRRQADPISKFVRAHRSQAARAATQAITTLHGLVAGKTDAADRCETCDATATAEAYASELSTALARFAEVLPRTGGGTSPRYLLVNPLSFARRIGVELPQLAQPPQTTAPVIASGLAENRNFAVVEVPPMGFAWVEAASSPPHNARAKPIARENTLRNEFFEVTISRGGGGIQSLFSFQQRGNQLSQQLAMRTSAAAHDAAWTSADAEACYTTMRAESVEVTVASTALGEIVSRGALLDADGRRVAGFRQTTRAWAGSRILSVDVELDATEELRADPWNSYYAARFAWPDETADLWRGVGLARQKTQAARLEAPEYIEIDNGSGTISILTGGLPYHRRSQERMIDSLLIVRGETERRFSLAIGVDVPQAAAAALEFVAPVASLYDSGPPPTTASGWFFHVGAKNVVATHWQPLADDRSGDDVDNKECGVRGFRARLLETAGQAGRVTLRTYRGVATARQVDFLGQTLLELAVDGDRIILDFAAFEWIEVEAVWS